MKVTDPLDQQKRETDSMNRIVSHRKCIEKFSNDKGEFDLRVGNSANEGELYLGIPTYSSLALDEGDRIEIHTKLKSLLVELRVSIIEWLGERAENERDKLEITMAEREGIDSR